MGQYEDCWEIEYYFNFVVRNRIKKQKEKNPFGVLFMEEDISKLNAYSRTSLVKNRKVQLSHFQEFMLNLTFGSIDESPFSNI